MCRCLIIVLLCFGFCYSKSQNIILNGSFENHIPPYDNLGDFYHFGLPITKKLLIWEPLNSPDFFHKNYLFNSGYQVPNNLFGSSYAKHGDAYVGAFLFDTLNHNVREYFYQELSQTLIADSTYCLSLNIKRASGSYWATGNLGILFTQQVPVIPTGYLMITDSPQVLFPQIITDTSNWVHLSARYKANGTEQYITFGNFSNDALIPKIKIKANTFTGASQYAYYFFDSISMYLCDALPPILPPTDTTQAPPQDEPNLPNVFTPNGDGTNDVFSFTLKNGTVKSFAVYNRWGNIIYMMDKNSSPSGRLGGASWDGHTTVGEPCNDGVYFYVLEYTDAKGELKTKRGHVSLMR